MWVKWSYLPILKSQASKENNDECWQYNPIPLYKLWQWDNDLCSTEELTCKTVKGYTFKFSYVH